MLHTISLGSFILSILSFILLAIVMLSPLTRRAEGLAQAQQQGAIEGWAKLAEALSKVIDSLNKSSPTVITFLASIGFMIISLAAAKSG